MKSKNQRQNATPINNIWCTHVNLSEAIVYDGFAGIPTRVTFLNGRWWVTTPGMKLQPLENFYDGECEDFFYLCELGGKVGALALAKMLGLALTNPEEEVDRVLRNRVQSLKRLGVVLDLKDEPLVMELEIFPNEVMLDRQGKYSMWCHLADNYSTCLFDIDAFESKKDAETWANIYFDQLESLGIEFSII